MFDVLIMDHDQGLLEGLKTLFTKNGLRVITFSPRYDISHLVDIHNPRLVLVGYLMGQINGGELCTVIKENPETAHIPVIIFSDHDRIFNALGNYGCDLFLPKTADVSTLLLNVKQLLAVKTIINPINTKYDFR